MLELASRQSIQIPDPSAIAIHCIAGCLWVTQEADPDDHILQTGDAIRFPGRGLVVAGALQRSVFRLTRLAENGGITPEIKLALNPDASHCSLSLAEVQP